MEEAAGAQQGKISEGTAEDEVKSFRLLIASKLVKEICSQTRNKISKRSSGWLKKNFH